MMEKLCVRKIIIFFPILVIILMLRTESVKAETRIEGDGCSTPEEAVMLYLHGLENGDMNQMLSAFAIESYVDNYKLEEQVETAAWLYVEYVPNVSEYARRLNIEQRKRKVTEMIRAQYRGWNSTGRADLEKGETGAECLRRVFYRGEDLWFSHIKADGAFESPSVLGQSDHWDYEENANRNQKEAIQYLGGEQIKEVAADFIWMNMPFVLCARTIEYQEKWYILDFNTVLYMGIGGSAYEYGGIVPLFMFDNRNNEIDTNSMEEFSSEFLDRSNQSHSVFDTALPKQKGFRQPEEALQFYLNGLEKNDIDQMFSAFAMEEYVKNYRLDKEIEYDEVYEIHEFVSNLSENTEGLNLAKRKAHIATLFFEQYLELTDAACYPDVSKVQENVAGSGEQKVSGKEKMERCFSMNDSVYLKNIHFIGNIRETDSCISRESFSSDTDALLTILGADGIVFRTAEIEVNGQLYTLYADIICYDKRWFLMETEIIKADGKIRISVNGEEYGVYSLEEEQTIKIGDTNVCIIKNGQCRMTEASCPEHLCIEQGAIDNRGGTIICLPNKVVIEVVEADRMSENGIDTVIR